MCNCKQNEFELLPELEAYLNQGSVISNNNEQKYKKSKKDVWDLQYEDKRGLSKKGSRPNSVSNHQALGKVITPSTCVTPFSGQLPKHLEGKLLRCINKVVDSKDIAYLFQKTLEANNGSIWINKLNTDLKTFLTLLYPSVNLTIELWSFIIIPKGHIRYLQRALSDYLYKKSPNLFTASIIAPIGSQATIQKISGMQLNSFVASAGALPSSNHTFYWHVYATFPADVKNNFRTIEWNNIDKFEFNKADLSQKQKEALSLTARDIVESWLPTSTKRYTKVTLEGHTDSRGTETYNMELGKKRARVAGDYLKKEIIRIAPAYYLDSSKMKINYDIVSFGETRPISKKTPIIHEFNRRVEIKLSGVSFTAKIPLVLADVIKRCIKVLNSKKTAINQNYYKRIGCLLTIMQNPQVDDRFITDYGALDVYNKNVFPATDEFVRVRFWLTNESLFSNQRTDEQIFQAIINLDQAIQQGIDLISKKVSSHMAIMYLPLPNSFDKLAKWISQQAKIRNSIYSCY